MADEEAPVEDADNAVEETPAEDADPEVDAVEADAEDAAAPSGAQPDDGASGIKSPRGVAGVAAVVAGAVVASAAAIVGAVWAIAAIVDDDDYYGDCCVVDLATSIDPDGKWGSERGSEPRAYRDDRSEHFERDRSERREQAERQERREQAEQRRLERQERQERREQAERDKRGDGDYFEFRKRPRGLWFSPFSPFSEPNGEWPFRNGMPFDFEEFYERFFRDGLPFGFEDFEGRDGERDFEDLFGDGEEGKQGSFCFREGDEEECFSDFDQLSDEEREQLEQMMEMLDGFGLGGFFGGLEEFLDGLELEFGESQIDPSGVTGA